MDGRSHVRPHWLPYRAKDGIVGTFLGLDGPEDNLSSYFDRAIAWSQAAETGSFRLLDSFLSDALTVDLLAKILRLSTSAHPAQILIVDPESDFALARAKSIGQVAAKEVRIGICNILRAIQVVSKVSLPDLATSAFDDLLTLLHDYAPGVTLEVRFYSEVPSGPHYFLKDILLSGRFCAGLSSSKLPWTMIVDNPHYKGDLYDIYSSEFERIWDKARPRPEQRIKGVDSVSAEKPSYDLAIITATQAEWDALKGLPRVQWQKIDAISVGSSIFYGAEFESAGRRISVVATQQGDPGMVCAAIATTNLLRLARVTFLAVVGVCAAVRGRASLGSVVIASQVFDAQAGKFVDGRFQSNIDSINLDRSLFQMMKDRSASYIVEASKTCAHLMPLSLKEPQVVYGKVATVAQVIADSSFAKQIWSQSRQCVALEMESYGAFRAVEEVSSERRPRSFFIKTAVDFADKRKSDRYQEFGAALSANFLWCFVLDSLAK
jgi:nucleoside phosphorylase